MSGMEPKSFKALFKEVDEIPSVYSTSISSLPTPLIYRLLFGEFLFEDLLSNHLHVKQN